MATMRAAQTYTIESIMAMKDRYTDPPYPGFDLLDVCRKRSAQGPQRLPKGENAWTVTKPHSSSDVIRKLVRGTLNKLTPEKYNEIVEGLDFDELLEDTAMQIAIDLIFAKALQEPGYSRIYAKFCLDIAKYEVSKTSPPNSADADRKPPRSHFRNHIVARAQQEFQRREQVDPNLPLEVRNEMQAAEVKRKRANITFVGQLYMHKVLSSSVMHRIISSLLNYDAAAKVFPEEIDIEVLCELLETIGKTIDLTEDGRAQMDLHFESLSKLLKMVNTKQLPYGAKVKFKLLDTLELRDNDWVPRVERTGGMTPATLKELQQREHSGTGVGLVLNKTVKSPTSKTPNRKFVPQFPSAPNTSSEAAGPSPPPNPWNRGIASLSLPNTPARAPASTPKPAETPKISFDERVSNLLREYLETREAMRDWDQPFYDYPDVTEENVSDLVAAAAIRDACMGTGANAQVDCCQFLVQGIGIGKVPLLTGVGRVVVQAVQEDTLSDVPLFYARLVHILEHCCGGETVDVYRDAIVSTFFAFDQLRNDESLTPIPELLKFWESLPKQGVDSSVIGAVVASRGGEQSANQLVVALISFLIDHNVISKDSLQAWLSTPQAQSNPDLLNLLAALTA